MLDRDLSRQALPDWKEEFRAGAIVDAGYSEVLFHPQRMLILAGVVQRLHSDRLPALTRAFVLLLGTSPSTTPRYFCAVLRLRHG